MTLVAAAWTCADAAAARIGVRVAEPTGMADLGAVAALLQRVWRASHPAEIASASLLRTYVHSGNYVAAAYRDDRLIGATVGFFGRDPAGTPHLHSFVAGVEPGGLGKGVGFALKQHQRAWTLEHGVSEVHWTFDPLVLRNAYFNLQKLGGTVIAYLPEFYGPMSDGINSGDLSDRLYLVWRLDSARAVAAAQGEPAQVDLEGVPGILERAADGAPLSTEDAVEVQLPKLFVAVPEDVEALRERDPGIALRWRHAVREALGGRLAAGWRIAGISRDGRYLVCEGDACD